MIDVFVRVWASTMLRYRLAQAVTARVAMLEGAQVNVLACCESLIDDALQIWPAEYLPADRFAMTSRAAAESMAKSRIYVLIDDDQLPIGKTWLFDGVAALVEHPEYAMLSSWSINGEVAETAGPHTSKEVFEVGSAGTPCFVRKGTFVDLPEGSAQQYDNVLSAHLRRNGARLGFLRHVRHNHLGYGLSQVVPSWWKA